MQQSIPEQLVGEIASTPETVLSEVLDFLLFLKDRAGNSASATTLASEAMLARDWLLQEEEEAWQSL